VQAGQSFLLHPATVCLKMIIVQKRSSLGYPYQKKQDGISLEGKKIH
jgi:hypothetical protein